jgi:hypothetical protein
MAIDRKFFDHVLPDGPLLIQAASYVVGYLPEDHDAQTLRCLEWLADLQERDRFSEFDADNPEWAAATRHGGEDAYWSVQCAGLQFKGSGSHLGTAGWPIGTCCWYVVLECGTRALACGDTPHEAALRAVVIAAAMLRLRSHDPRQGRPGLETISLAVIRDAARRDKPDVR